MARRAWSIGPVESQPLLAGFKAYGKTVRMKASDRFGMDWLLDRLRAPLGLAIAIWLVYLAQVILLGDMRAFGVRPGEISGLIGLVTAPFIHVSPGHLLANTLPLIVLGIFVNLNGRNFWAVSIFVAIAGGGLTWLLGRPVSHVGASGLVFGFFGYILMRAWRERSLAAISLALAAMLLYGGLIWGIFPSFVRRYSWEGHLFGLIAGGLAGYLAAMPKTGRTRRS